MVNDVYVCLYIDDPHVGGVPVAVFDNLNKAIEFVKLYKEEYNIYQFFVNSSHSPRIVYEQDYNGEVKQ